MSRSHHFSVKYPSSWNRLQNPGVAPDPDMLEIINFPNAERVEGVVIKKAGASITVNSAPGRAGSTEDWIQRYADDNVILDDRQVPMTSPGPTSCLKMRRVVIRDQVAPGAYSIETQYFCSTTRGLYVAGLTNWEGDPHQSTLQDIALKVVLSLKVR